MMENKIFTLFVNTDAVGANCRLEADERENAAVLHSTDFARYGLKLEGHDIKVNRGEKYRLKAWVKAGSDAELQRNSPGVLLRATLFNSGGTDANSGHIYVGLKGVAELNPRPLRGDKLPTDWTLMEGVVEIPDGVAVMKLHIFCWRTKGTVAFRSPSVELVDAGTPKTPIKLASR